MQQSKALALWLQEHSNFYYIHILHLLLMLSCFQLLSYLTNLEKGKNIFHYLFSLMNGLQGVWLFLLFVYQEYMRYRARKRKALASNTTSSLPLTNNSSNSPKKGEELQDNDACNVELKQGTD